MQNKIKITLKSPKINFEIFVSKKDEIIPFLTLFTKHKDVNNFFKRVLSNVELIINNTENQNIKYSKTIGNFSVKIGE